MPSMQNLVLTRPRLQWGDKTNLVILFIFQVLAVIVLMSAPFLMGNLLGRWKPVFDIESLVIFLCPVRAGCNLPGKQLVGIQPTQE